MSSDQMARSSEAVWTLLIATALFAAWQLGFRRLFVVEFQEQVLAMRHQLFALVEQGRISPNDPAYTRARNFLNSLVRYADDLCLSTLLGHMWVWRGIENDEPRRRWKELLARIDDHSVRRELDRAMRNGSQAAVLFVIRRSPATWFLIIPTLPLVGFKFAAAAAKRAWDGMGQPAEAFSCGILMVALQTVPIRTDRLQAPIVRIEAEFEARHAAVA